MLRSSQQCSQVLQLPLPRVNCSNSPYDTPSIIGVSSTDIREHVSSLASLTLLLDFRTGDTCTCTHARRERKRSPPDKPVMSLRPRPACCRFLRQWHPCLAARRARGVCFCFYCCCCCCCCEKLHAMKLLRCWSPHEQTY